MTKTLDRVVVPASEEELAEAIRNSTGPLRIRGGGTRPVGNPVEGQLLSTSGLKGIELYDPGALTLVVRAGTPLAEVEAALAAERQRLPFEPMDHRPLLGTEGEPTIGGVAAANVSGPRRISVGAARDYMLGVRFVDGTGTVVRNGGRVMKNVTGYDLVKLMAGSWGTLGVLTEIAFKVLPMPEASATLTVEVPDVETAIPAMSVALGSPYGVTGAAFDADIGVMLRIEGFESSVTYRAAQLSTLLHPFGMVRTETDPEVVTMTWRNVRDAVVLAEGDEDVWRISVRPSQAPEVARRLGSDVRLLFDWGGGLIWAGVPPETDLRAALGGIGGHATLVHAAPDTRARLGAFEPEPPAIVALSKSLQLKFDPRGIINQGLMERLA